MKLNVSVRETDLDREIKTHRGLKGFGHYYIDSYFLINHAMPHSDSGLYVFSSLTSRSQTTLGLQDSRELTEN